LAARDRRERVATSLRPARSLLERVMLCQVNQHR